MPEPASVPAHQRPARELSKAVLVCAEVPPCHRCFLFVWPCSALSSTSPQSDSVITVSLSSYAGQQQQSRRSTSGPEFQSLCLLPGGIAMASPALISHIWPSIRTRPSPCVI